MCSLGRSVGLQMGQGDFGETKNSRQPALKKATGVAILNRSLPARAGVNSPSPLCVCHCKMFFHYIHPPICRPNAHNATGLIESWEEVSSECQSRQRR